ncbi:type III secretion system chaperone [Phaeobacter sp. HF9A]|uniref:type III secretion system chaperone n=1 Tax=Phaeobacter sp. HF9A TaxID=2721561 RepID=UPI001430A62F|nr:type III secretion system chaperone [Phaeobacter sp. HF9A]NIZ11992.1 type III secretion system chaperone [Phaeobacter sp. HF9A]
MTLRNMHDVVSTIAEAAGLGDLAPNAEGVFELIVADSLSVYFRFDGEDVLELAVEVPALAKAKDPAVLSEMLAVNTSSPDGRLGMEPGTGRVFFGQRLLIPEVTRSQLLRRIDAFIRAAAPWQSTSAQALLERARAASAEGEIGAVMPDTVLRA